MKSEFKSDRLLPACGGSKLDFLPPLLFFSPSLAFAQELLQ